MSYAILIALDKNKIAEFREEYHIPAEWSKISEELDHTLSAFEKYPLEDEWCKFYYTNEYVSGTDGMMIIQALMLNIQWLAKTALVLNFRPIETQDDVDSAIQYLKSVLVD